MENLIRAVVLTLGKGHLLRYQKVSIKTGELQRRVSGLVRASAAIGKRHCRCSPLYTFAAQGLSQLSLTAVQTASL